MAKSQISEFLSLSPKVYTVRTSDEKVIKKVKGVKRSVVQKEISGEFQTALMRLIQIRKGLFVRG